jgi:response regulator RpfG family c-di-GMP phosphodiesterase
VSRTPLRVIVADDDPAVRNVLHRILETGGYRVAQASNGQAALLRFREHGADAILSDLQMPLMPGMALLREVRRIDDTVAFIILTGAGTMEDAVEALRLQADDYLVKPFNVSEVLLATERAVSYRRLLRENRAYQQHLEARVSEQAAELESLLLDALRALATAIETRDDYTGGHVDRVARYAAATGREMGLSGDALHALWVGALLHDVGKIGVPDGILRKPGPLSAAEYVEMQRHPEIGAGIMKTSAFLRPGLSAVLHHQERWDGTGYPSGLEGDQISLEGRIVAVVDTFDAIISARPYRSQRSVGEALAEIRRCAGTQFDPAVVQAFLRAADRGFPPDPDAPRLPER